MKHPLNLTFLLVAMFLCAQLIGLLIISEYVDIKASHATGTTVKNTEVYERIGLEPPEVQNESTSFIFILGSVLLGTVLILLIIQFKKHNLWKLWYFFAVLLSILVALNPFVYKAMIYFGLVSLISPYILTIIISAILGGFKVFLPNIYLHNLTEILVYGGLAALLVPILNLFSVAILLVFISIYDAYAVWKSKHMVKMAEFQKDTNLFAGFSFPYRRPKEDLAVRPSGKIAVSSKIIQKKAEKGQSTAKTVPASAILGGGDIAFPLLFAGVVMKTTGSYLYPFIVAVVTSIALFVLFARAEKGKFYPAMPFLSVGCFLGLFVCWLISLI
jgi:presenilin-like A22 family membrane protease